jgi:hypothetical protein
MRVSRVSVNHLLVSVLSRFLQRDWKLSFSLLNSAEVYTLLAHTWHTGG